MRPSPTTNQDTHDDASTIIMILPMAMTMVMTMVTIMVMTMMVMRIIGDSHCAAAGDVEENVERELCDDAGDDADADYGLDG